jgi:hypothetical protein
MKANNNQHPEGSLKVIILSAVALLVVTFAASFVLDQQHSPAYESYVGSGARVSNPGTNLVGPNWYGTNDTAAPNS